MTTLEAIAVVFSIVCVVLAARQHVGNWPAGIVAVVAYFVVFMRSKLYADAALQIIFFGQSLYGWYHWRSAATSAANARIGRLAPGQRIALAATIATVSMALGATLARYTDASRPFLDATVSVSSLAANWLLARRIIETWALWLIADVLYIVLFISKELFASAALYCLFLGLAVAGWRSWRRAIALPNGAAAS